MFVAFTDTVGATRIVNTSHIVHLEVLSASGDVRFFLTDGATFDVHATAVEIQTKLST